jgi:hypothetical protein
MSNPFCANESVTAFCLTCKKRKNSMCRKIYACVGFALVVVGSLLVGSASAAFIPINNASFGDQALADGESISTPDYAPTGWTTLGTPAYVLQHNPTYGGELTPWLEFQGAAGDAGIPTGGASPNVWTDLMYQGANGYVTQALTSQVQAGTYKLTVAMGTQGGSGYTPLDSVSVGITTTTLGYGEGLARNNWTPSNGGAGLPVATLQDYSVGLVVAPGDPHIGQTLQIFAGGNNTLGGLQSVSYSNARLEFTPVPEPGTLVLMTSALIGLVCYAWRKRK